ncbi:Ubiquitin-specific protease, partial [Globisporangium splendens]
MDQSRFSKAIALSAIPSLGKNVVVAMALVTTLQNRCPVLQATVLCKIASNGNLISKRFDLDFVLSRVCLTSVSLDNFGREETSPLVLLRFLDGYARVTVGAGTSACDLTVAALDATLKARAAPRDRRVPSSEGISRRVGFRTLPRQRAAGIVRRDACADHAAYLRRMALWMATWWTELMDTGGSQALCKKDTMAFLSTIADGDNIVAIETHSDVSTAATWTVTALAELLHPTASERLTPSKLVKALSTKRFSTFHLTDWLPRFAAQFQFAAGESPVASPRMSPTSAITAEPPPRTRAANKECSFRSPVELPTPTFTALRSEFHGILEYLANTSEPLDIDTFLQRLSGMVSDKVLAAVRKVDTLVPAFGGNARGKDETLASRQGRQAFKRWVLMVLSAFARDATGIMRLLFAMLDDRSKGAIDTLQFAAFLRFSSCLSHEESERLASILVDQICRSSSTASPPTSPTASQISTVIDAPRISVTRFVELAHSVGYAENMNISWGDLEIIHLIFHLVLLDDAGDRQFIALQSIKQCTTQLRLAKQKAQAHDDGFCLLPRRQWNHIISVVCDAVDAFGDDDEKDTMAMHEALVNDAGVPLTEPKHEDRVLVPLPLWIVLCFWQRHQLQMEPSCWKRWSTTLDMSLYGDDTVFRGFCVALDLQLVAVDGMEFHCTVPYSVVSANCSIQDLVDAVRLQRQWQTTGSSLDSTRTLIECQLQFLPDATSESAKSTPVTAPEHLLVVPVSELLSSIGVSHDGSIHQFKLRVSVADLMEPRDDSSNEEPQNQQQEDVGISPRRSHLRRVTRLHASTGERCPVHGLANLGNTCFMNSALQCLATTPLLREYFLHHEYLYDLAAHGPAVGNIESKNYSVGASPNAFFLPLAFGQLVAEMNAFSSSAVSGVCDVIAPAKIQRAIALLFPQLFDGTQQDAQEFLSLLLSSLGDELKRQSVHPNDSDQGTVNSSDIKILSPQSRAFLARLPSFSSRTRENGSGTSTASPETSTSAIGASSLRFQVSDSDGRPDAEVAREWWIAHLLNELSICSALFCGQFKSALTCNVCGATSARFEPFASLQLLLVSGTNRESSHQDGDTTMQRTVTVIVLLHSAKPSKSGAPCILRLVVHAGMDWTLEQLLLKLQQRDHHSVSHSIEHHQKFIAGVVDGCCIREYVDHNTLLATIPSTVDAFELGHEADGLRQDEDLAIQPTDHEFHVGDELMVWTAQDRFVKAIVTLVHDTPSPRSKLGLEQSRGSLSTARYDMVLIEGLRRGVSMRYIARVRPVGAKRTLVIRIIHRRGVLVPFYCTSPHRLVLCGSPTLYCVQSTSVTGKSLYRFVQQRFLRASSVRTTTAFALRRVHSDGKCCARCHWTTRCVGCLVPRTNAALEDLEMDETIAIDWNASSDLGDKESNETADPLEWLYTTGRIPIKDDDSYVQYRQTHSQSLARSLEILSSSSEPSGDSCAVDQNARPQHKNALSPHIKKLSLWSVPPILIVQLKRFELGPGYMWEKLHHCIDFPIESLDLAPFLETSTSQACSATASEPVQRATAFLQQELQFPLETASRACAGQVSHIKHPESGEWWLVDDASAAPVAVETLAPSAAVYLLFYVRHDIVPPSPRADESAAAGSLKTESSSSIRHERMRLSSFYPRKSHASRLSEMVIHEMWQQETWTHAATSSGQFVKDKRENADEKCNFM